MYGNADFCIRPRILNLERCRPGWVTYGKLKKEKYSSPDSIATDGEGELHSKKLGANGLEGAIFFLSAQQKTTHFGSEQDET